MLIFCGNNNYTCFTVCDSEPPEKEYATKEVHKKIYGDLLVEGYSFRYTCVESYNSHGTDLSTCQEDGTWSSTKTCFLSKIKTYIQNNLYTPDLY